MSVSQILSDRRRRRSILAPALDLLIVQLTGAGSFSCSVAFPGLTWLRNSRISLIVTLGFFKFARSCNDFKSRKIDLIQVTRCLVSSAQYKQLPQVSKLCPEPLSIKITDPLPEFKSSVTSQPFRKVLENVVLRKEVSKKKTTAS